VAQPPGSPYIIKEQERQAARSGKGTRVENGNDMMERADDTRKKRRQMILDNEEAVQAHKEEQHRQGFRYYTNAEQSGNERYINVKYQGGPDLQVPFDNSSTTSGVFAANPYRPIFNPYTQRSLYKNKRYLVKKNTNTKTNETNSHISNNKKENKTRYAYQKSSEGVVKRKIRKGKDQQARMKTLPNTTHQSREAEQDHKHIQQKTTEKTSRTRSAHALRQTSKNQSETNYSQPSQTK
jgi:hypothetical protein